MISFETDSQMKMHVEHSLNPLSGKKGDGVPIAVMADRVSFKVQSHGLDYTNAIIARDNLQ